MLHAYVPHLNTVVGRLLGGVLIMSADHPVAMALILAALAGTSGAVLFDAVVGRP